MKTLVKKIDVCGIEYKVYIASRDDEPALADADAVCDTDLCYIKIRDDVPKAKIADTVLHEVMHALFEGSGIGHALQLETRNHHDLEERIIRMLVPHLRATLKQMKRLI